MTIDDTAVAVATAVRTGAQISRGLLMLALTTATWAALWMVAAVTAVTLGHNLAPLITAVAYWVPLTVTTVWFAAVAVRLLVTPTVRNQYSFFALAAADAAATAYVLYLADLSAATITALVVLNLLGAVIAVQLSGKDSAEVDLRASENSVGPGTLTVVTTVTGVLGVVGLVGGIIWQFAPYVLFLGDAEAWVRHASELVVPGDYGVASASQYAMTKGATWLVAATMLSLLGLLSLAVAIVFGAARRRRRGGPPTKDDPVATPSETRAAAQRMQVSAIVLVSASVSAAAHIGFFAASLLVWNSANTMSLPGEITVPFIVYASFFASLVATVLIVRTFKSRPSDRRGRWWRLMLVWLLVPLLMLVVTFFVTAPAHLY
ncbi:MAG: hypothetical protein KF680_03700 [Cryobacterium sp.]|nr:hypothetical protein [Cryobacterium sp.]